MIDSATIKLSSGTGVLYRPIQLLYPLEVHDNCKLPVSTSQNKDSLEVEVDHTDDKITIILSGNK